MWILPVSGVTGGAAAGSAPNPPLLNKDDHGHHAQPLGSSLPSGWESLKLTICAVGGNIPRPCVYMRFRSGFVMLKLDIKSYTRIHLRSRETQSLAYTENTLGSNA